VVYITQEIMDAQGIEVSLKEGERQTSDGWYISSNDLVMVNFLLNKRNSS